MASLVVADLSNDLIGIYFVTMTNKGDPLFFVLFYIGIDFFGIFNLQSYNYFIWSTCSTSCCMVLTIGERMFEQFVVWCIYHLKGNNIVCNYLFVDLMCNVNFCLCVYKFRYYLNMFQDFGSSLNDHLTGCRNAFKINYFL